jgi:hypothetical protein
LPSFLDEGEGHHEIFQPSLFPLAFLIAVLLTKGFVTVFECPAFRPELGEAHEGRR